MLTELGRSQVEVQRCSLNLAGPRLKSWQGGSGHGSGRSGPGGGEGGRRRTTLIKSNNPHLAGGEKKLPPNTGF